MSARLYDTFGRKYKLLWNIADSSLSNLKLAYTFKKACRMETNFSEKRLKSCASKGNLFAPDFSVTYIWARSF